MSWTYQQSTGELTAENGSAWRGYSGTGDGRNNPNMQDVPDVGPIPVGTYAIRDAYDDPHLGPCVMHLDPTEDTDTFGRSLFRIHGDNAAHDASHGCVIMGPTVRNLISTSNDKTLVVVS